MGFDACVESGYVLSKFLRATAGAVLRLFRHVPATPKNVAEARHSVRER